MSEDSSSGSEYLSSDEELQEEFSKGLLQPGLIVRNAPPKKFTNDVACMKEQLAKLKRKELKWLERMDITETVGTAESSKQDLGGERADMDAEDDFKREMHFFRQAQSSVLIGLRKLEELGVPLQRPDDYFAEMIKTDDHMKKVRQSLLSRQKILEQKEKARKMRELKKYGKKVQQEILQKRRTEKKAVLDSVNKLKRGKGGRPSFIKQDDEEGSFPVTTARTGTPGLKEGGVAWKKKRVLMDKSQKRKLKDQKFGFGGKKKWLKSNTAESSADMSSFRAEKHGQKSVRRDGNKWDKAGGRGKRDGGPGGKSGSSRGKRGAGPGGKSGRSRGKTGGGPGGKIGSKKNKTVRLGKSRRQKMKL